MSQTKLQQLSALGQSVWLDYIDRPLLETGKLDRMINEGLRGMTSNPAIFNNAIGHSHDYDGKIVQLKDQGKTIFEIYDALTIQDICDAADRFKGVYDDTGGLDGYVSLEINPQLADDTDASIKEGIRLFDRVKRPNVMIKVPATDAGFPVIEELISRGINVNTTLIFSVTQYEKTVKAYYRGLARLAEVGGDLSKVRSVASVFISRVDAVVDDLLDDKISDCDDAQAKQQWQVLKGKAAVANARIIFEKWFELLLSDEVKTVEGKEANIQRILWASTGTKNPDYSDVKYVTELISNPSVNTLPEKTLEFFMDHGQVKEALTDDVNDAKNIIQSLKDADIDIDQICLKLLNDGVVAFEKAFEQLFASLERKAKELSSVK